jgi:hypothetical protein
MRQSLYRQSMFLRTAVLMFSSQRGKALQDLYPVHAPEEIQTANH